MPVTQKKIEELKNKAIKARLAWFDALDLLHAARQNEQAKFFYFTDALQALTKVQENDETPS